MKWMGWNEADLHAARSATIAEIVAMMQEQAEAEAEATDGR